MESSGEIEEPKVRKREIKGKLREARFEYDAIKEMNLSKSERTLRKADKKTTIDGIEKILERTREEIHSLERDQDQTFKRRERIKERTVRRMRSSGNKEAGQLVLVKNKLVGDVAAVAKMMELMRASPSPSSEIGSSPMMGGSGESINYAPAKQVDSKLKLKFIGEGIAVEKTSINTVKRRAASIKLR